MSFQQDRIVEVAREQFFSLGFSRVSMDEIAHQLGMSKRTLYRHFPSKKELLREALVGKVKQVSRKLKDIIEAENEDFIERLRGVFSTMALETPRLSQAFLKDLQRNASDVWEELDRERQQTIHTQFRHFFEEGINKGFFKRDLDPDLLIFMMSALAQGVLTPEILSELPVSNIQAVNMVFTVLFHGMLTPQAKAKSRSPRKGKRT